VEALTMNDKDHDIPLVRRRALLLRGLAAVAGAGALGPAWGQADWARVAVPAYGSGDVVRGLYRFWSLPRADDFVAAAQALVAALRGLAEAPAASAAPAALLGPARARWRAAMLAWERLSAVSVGPLIERRSARQIDFTPTRPALIERAIQAQPQGAEAMERIGTPAQGLPALEWLLWTRPPTSGSPAARYALEVASAVEREALALQAALRTLGERDWADAGEEAVAGLNEFINQWVGGLERLRWAHMEKPLRAGTPGELPRAASGATAESWAAQWEAFAGAG
jgi:predicted lipoprotein